MSEFSDVIPFWKVDIDYPEGSLVIKEGILCRYWGILKLENWFGYL